MKVSGSALDVLPRCADVVLREQVRGQRRAQVPAGAGHEHELVRAREAEALQGDGAAHAERAADVLQHLAARHGQLSKHCTQHSICAQLSGQWARRAENRP